MNRLVPAVERALNKHTITEEKTPWANERFCTCGEIVNILLDAGVHRAECLLQDQSLVVIQRHVRADWVLQKAEELSNIHDSGIGVPLQWASKTEAQKVGWILAAAQWVSQYGDPNE